MNPKFIKDPIVDLQNDTKFEKLASFGAEGKLTAEDMAVDIRTLLEKQAYADDSTYADPMNRTFSIASPVETKISALYAEKCASSLDEEVVNRINDACNIYGIDIQVPVMNKVASITDDKEIMEAIDVFDHEYEALQKEDEGQSKYASCEEYGNQLDECLAARAYYATKPEEVEVIDELQKLASQVTPDTMVSLIQELDIEMGMDSPRMQNLVGTPEYAVYEKVASEATVKLTSNAVVPIAVIEENKDVLADMGVELDWDGTDEFTLAQQIEKLPSQIKEELAACCGKEK